MKLYGTSEDSDCKLSRGHSDKVTTRDGLVEETAKKSQPRNWFWGMRTSEGSEWYQIDHK